MNFIRRKFNKKGFTIIELIAVMAVLAVLVTLGVPKFLNHTKDAKVTAMQADTKIIESAALQYYLANENIEDDSRNWPVGNEAEGVNEDIEFEGEAYEIDGVALDSYIRSTSNDMDSYFIVVGEGSKDEGRVFSKNICFDGKGNGWSGLDKIVDVEVDTEPDEG